MQPPTKDDWLNYIKYIMERYNYSLETQKCI